MITAKPTGFGRWLWETMGRIGIRRRFQDFVLVDPVEVPENKAVILVGNHMSWWDGFFAMEVNRRLWKKDFYVMMLEDQLMQRPFMRRTGAFSVKPGSRGTLDSVQYTVKLLENPDNLVLIFPQGKIHSQYERSFRFGSGLQKIRSKSPEALLIFFATFLDYGSHPRPTVRIYTQIFETDGSLSAQYQSFFQQAEKAHILTTNE